jgi:hypothetical protein
MNIPWKTLRNFAVFAGAVYLYLNAVEMALPSARKADRLPTTIVCAVSDYEQGACL